MPNIYHGGREGILAVYYHTESLRGGSRLARPGAYEGQPNIARLLCPGGCSESGAQFRGLLVIELGISYMGWVSDTRWLRLLRTCLAICDNVLIFQMPQ